MTLQPTMRRRIHERLHPLIGEEEADALLDALPDDPPTKEWMEERFSTKEQIDHRFDRIDDRFDRIDDRFEAQREYFDARFEGQDHKMVGESHRVMAAIAQLETRIQQAFIQQTRRVYTAAGLFALVISIVDRIWG